MLKRMVLILGVLVAGCGTRNDPAATANPAQTAKENSQTTQKDTAMDTTPCCDEIVEPLVLGNTAFGFDLYARLKTTDGNLFFSPYSLSTALAMTFAGAQGTTERQMARTLHFEPSKDHLHPAFGCLIAHLNRLGQAGDVQLSVANALWLQQDYAFLQAYLDRVSAHYKAAFEPVDFVTQTEQTRLRINDWTAQQTQGKIQDLIPEGALHALTRLVLTNAIYFKGDWELPFDADKTRQMDFHVTDDKRVATPMMTHKEKFRYAQTDAIELLELPYTGQTLSMLVLLPKEKHTLAALEAELTAENLNRWQQALRKQEVVVYLPKFKIASRFGLKETLSAMGMPEAFSPAANFSGMDGTRELFISDVLHKAFVEVNEEGTEAAAATGIIVGITAIPTPPPVFRADHPFVFVIRDNATGSVLFMGRVADPTQSD